MTREEAIDRVARAAAMTTFRWYSPPDDKQPAMPQLVQHYKDHWEKFPWTSPEKEINEAMKQVLL